MEEDSEHIIKKPRINERIYAREVRLVGEKGEQLGVMPLPQALEMARKQGFDLVEVAATAVPPVCRIMDYGKYKFEMEKKERKARKNQRASLLREIRLRPKIGDHDFDAKARSVIKLVSEGDKVMVSVLFRGREITHPELGWNLLKRMAETVKDVANPEKQPAMEGRRMNIILAPLSAQKLAAQKKVAVVQPTKEKEEVKKA